MEKDEQEQENKTAIENDMEKADSGSDKSDLIISLEMLLNEKNIKGKTILNNRQVTAITLMNWAGQVYDISFLREFVHEWSRYKISGNDGQGRKDLIEIAKALQLEKERNNILGLDLRR